MKKKEIRTVEVEVEVCDICEKEGSLDKCEICRKLTCQRCSKDYETGLSSDEQSFEQNYCSECKDKYVEFFLEIENYKKMLDDKQKLEDKLNDLRPYVD